MPEKHQHEDAEEVKEILSVVSTEIPTLIKNILSSVFSEEAGRNMGKAAAAFYKELKDSGIPNETAIRMTEDYTKTFTGFGDLLKQSMRARVKRIDEDEDEDEEQLSPHHSPWSLSFADSNFAQFISPNHLFILPVILDLDDTGLESEESKESL